MRSTWLWLSILVWAISTPARSAPHRPPIIDAHAHLSYGAQALIQRTMEQNGIRYMVNLSGGAPGRGLEGAVELAKALDGKILNFYTPDWLDFESPDWAVLQASNLDVAVRAYGYRGLKISKHLGLGLRWKSGVLVDVDDPHLDPLWERAGVLGVPVAIHVGDPVAFFEPLGLQNERWDELSVHPEWSFAGPEFPRHEELVAALERVIARHPRTTFICVHFGNYPENIDYVEHLLASYPNAYVDIAARIGEIGRHPAARVKALFERFSSRILFGTDIGLNPRGIMLGSVGKTPSLPEHIAPFYAAHFQFLETTEPRIAHPVPIQGNWTVDAIGLSPEVLKKVYWSNAAGLLGVSEGQ